MTIEPSAIYPPGSSGPRYTGGQYYVLNDPPPISQPSFPQRISNRIPQQSVRAQIPSNLPAFLRANPVNNRSIVFNAWVIAMIIIGFDEWHNLGILPRPSRLWDATLVYGVLVMVGFVDAMVPLANALAIGYTIMLLWQYYNGNITPATGTPPTGGITQNANFGQNLQNAGAAAVAAGNVFPTANPTPSVGTSPVG